MRISLNVPLQRVAILTDGALRVYDITETPKLSWEVPLERGDCVTSTDATIFVIAGKVAPAGASITKATLSRFSWELAPLGAATAGEVARYNLSARADGARVVVTDWKTCRVSELDATTGKVLHANGFSIPSGASYSPDGAWIVAGTADQGNGAILLFHAAGATDATLPMEELPPPVKPSVGLDDAPYASAFSRDGGTAALSNESWGGRGVFVYDVGAKKPLWSAKLPSSDEGPEAWFAFPVFFVAEGRVLVVGGPGELRAYTAGDGRALGVLKVPGDGRGGFVVDEKRWCAWLPGESPSRVELPHAWRKGDAGPLAEASTAAPVVKEKPVAKKKPRR